MKHTKTNDIENYLSNNLTFIFRNENELYNVEINPIFYGKSYSYFIQYKECNHRNNDLCDCEWENIMEDN